MSNILKVKFGKETQVVSSPLYQYDYGQKVKIFGLDLPAHYEVHFSNYERGDATTVLASLNEFDIPDMYLQSGRDVYVWIYLHTGDSDGETEYQITIPIIKRAKPTDEEPTPEEQSIIDQTIIALNNAVTEARAISEDVTGKDEHVTQLYGYVNAAKAETYNYKEDAEAAAELLENASAQAETLPAISEATATYSHGVFRFGIPAGKDGMPGPPGPIDLGITGANVGDFITVRTVDPDGAPTAWESIDMPPIAVGSVETALVGNDLINNVASGNYSSSFGSTNIVSGDYSFASGTGNNVSGSRSVAFGRDNIVTAGTCIAAGRGNNCERSYGVALGYGNIVGDANVGGTVNVAIGDTNTVKGTDSVAIGQLNTVTGQAAVAYGYQNTASGINSHAEGYKSTAGGQGSFAAGRQTSCTGNWARTDGEYTTAKNATQFVFGAYNVADPSSNATNQHGEYVEIVGNGTADNARSNARTLDWNGNEVLAGKLTLGAGPTANMDAATKQYVDDAIPGLNITGASADDLIKVTSIDANGTPTAWEPAMAGTDYPDPTTYGTTGVTVSNNPDIGTRDYSIMLVYDGAARPLVIPDSATADLIIGNSVEVGTGSGRLLIGGYNTVSPAQKNANPNLASIFVPVPDSVNFYGVSGISGTGATACGMGVNAKANGACAFGGNQLVTGTYSFTAGQMNYVSGRYAGGIGRLIEVQYNDQFAVGLSNDNQSTNAFEVGNGTTSTRSNAFYVTKAGSAIAQTSLGIEDSNGGVVSVTASELNNMKSNTLTSASIDASGLISFKNGDMTVFTLQLPMFDGSVSP